MTFKLEGFVKKLGSPVVLLIDGIEQEYENGLSAYEQSFDKYYIVNSVFTKNDKLYVELVEKDDVNMTNCCGEEQQTFF